MASMLMVTAIVLLIMVLLLQHFLFQKVKVMFATTLNHIVVEIFIAGWGLIGKDLRENG